MISSKAFAISLKPLIFEVNEGRLFRSYFEEP